MATTYTVRMEEENGNPVAYIDADGFAVIRQPHAPGNTEDNPWTSFDDAKAWADKHAEDLTNYSLEGDRIKAENERKAAEQDALLIQAKEDSKKLAEIYDMLKTLSAN